MGGSASSSPVVQKSLANFMDAMSGGLNSKPALDQYSKQFRNMPDAAIRGVGDAVASIPDMAIAAGKLAMEGGFNPRMGQSERVKRFADTTYMPINPMMQEALTRAGVAETEGGNNLTRFVSGAMAPYAMGKYAGAVGDAIGAAERGAASRLLDTAMGPGDRYVYHTSPKKISAINSSGLFDDGLHFSNEPYFMTAAENPTIYKMKINDADYINAQKIPYHEDYSKIEDVVNEIANRYDVSDDVALDLISENKNILDIDGIEDYGNAAWDIQRATLKAAKQLGYKGVIGNDEQGATYLTSMLGREKDLVDLAAERGALSNAEKGMVSIPTKSDLIKARQIVEDAAKQHGLEMPPTAGGGPPGWGGGMTNSKYASFRASAPDGKKFTDIDVRVSDHGEPMKRLQSGYGSNLSFDGSQSLDDFAAKANDLFASVSAKYKPKGAK